MKKIKLDVRKTYENAESSRWYGAKILLSGDLLTLTTRSVISNEDGAYLGESGTELSVHLADVLTHSEDHGFTLLTATFNNENEPVKLDSEQVINKTVVDKTYVLHYKHTADNRLGYLLTPSKSSDINDCTLLLFDDGFIDLSGIDFDDTIAFDSEGALDVNIFDKITLNTQPTVLANGSIDIIVNQAIPNTIIYLEATAGRLSHYRVTKSTTIKFFADGLEPGEVVKIKAGYKYWSGDAETLVEVV